ncbi:MAG TPA: condensation domain-containing protein, partial [Chitinispirillaceae bacterium]|nr:condensation domain-containing protein [Chitinispirillaceae bacterium]
TAHHIITDLRSNELICDSIGKLYNAGENVDVSASSGITYSQFAEWEREWRHPDKYLDEVSFWKKKLGDEHDVLDLPLDRPRPPYRSFNGNAVPCNVPEEIYREIQQLIKDPSINSFILLLTVYIALHYRYTGQDRIVIGVPFANRRKNSFKNTIGCFVNTIPIAVSVSDTTTFNELLAQTKSAVFEAHRHQEMPTEEILKALPVTINPAYNPLYQTGFTLNSPVNFVLDGLAIEPLFFHQGGSQLDFFVYMWECTGSIKGLLSYNTDIF